MSRRRTKGEATNTAECVTNRPAELYRTMGLSARWCDPLALKLYCLQKALPAELHHA